MLLKKIHKQYETNLAKPLQQAFLCVWLFQHFWRGQLRKFTKISKMSTPDEISLQNIPLNGKAILSLFFFF